MEGAITMNSQADRGEVQRTVNVFVRILKATLDSDLFPIFVKKYLKLPDDKKQIAIDYMDKLSR